MLKGRKYLKRLKWVFIIGFICLLTFSDFIEVKADEPYEIDSGVSEYSDNPYSTNVSVETDASSYQCVQGQKFKVEITVRTEERYEEGSHKYIGYLAFLKNGWQQITSWYIDGGVVKYTFTLDSSDYKDYYNERYLLFTASVFPVDNFTTGASLFDKNFTVSFPASAYTIKYDANGGYGAPDAQTKYQGTTLNLSTEKPAREGHTFLGWSTDSAASSASYSAGGEYKDNSSATLYAVWRKNTYIVNYDANGGSGEPSSQKKVHGEALTLSSIKPSKTGYTFLGWSADSSAASASYSAGEEYTENKDIILYAVWKENASDTDNDGDSDNTDTGHNDTSDSNGGSVSNPSGGSGTVKKEQSIITSASSYTKAIGSKAFSLSARAGGDGKLTYTSSNKKVAVVTAAGKVSVKSYGSATITINASGTQNYKSATKKIAIKVVPKKISLKAVKSPAKKKMKILWKKDKSVTGYEAYASPKKDFSSKTRRQIYKKNTVSRLISGCESKKTYYVKIRAYKTIGKNKYYGPWSNVKKVKIK